MEEENLSSSLGVSVCAAGCSFTMMVVMLPIRFQHQGIARKQMLPF
jgi:hypothetical protein